MAKFAKNGLLFMQLETHAHQLVLDRETADLTHIDQLETQLSRVNRLLTHLSDAVNGKDAILGQLQTTVVENSIKIKAPFQRLTAQLQLVKCC